MKASNDEIRDWLVAREASAKRSLAALNGKTNTPEAFKLHGELRVVRDLLGALR